MKVSITNIMEIKFIHSVNLKDILMFKKLCQPNSYFFSNSEAFINSYVNGHDSAYCYNDQETIFFFNRFDRNTYFFCCPKGINWQAKMFDLILKIKEKIGKKLKRIWIWELPEPIDDNYFSNKRFKSIKHVIQERPLFYLPDRKDLMQFLYRKVSPEETKKIRNLRSKWNRFFNFFNQDKGSKFLHKDLTSKDLTTETYQDASRILSRWKTYIGETKSNINQFISIEHIFEKNRIIIEDALRNPHLYESLILYYNGYPYGIVVAFKIEKSQAVAGSISCIDRTVPGAGEVLYLLFFESLAKKGYQYFNWGNSYQSSLDHFKRKFCPTGYEHSQEYFIDLKD